ncbi:hypothetical protein [Marinomonas sp. FW-1]|uniref:hypothetical protein n=1 Tax=Marinomonas sp. FW-1 TaxID=2071621 RepID=UPI0010C0F4F1|nr:hypothetical protein [Marinomonas sp. FW-1]
MSRDKRIDELVDMIRREQGVDDERRHVTGGYQPIRSEDRGYVPKKTPRPPAEKPSPPKKD